jgi:signal transduction histidine kinase
MNFPKITFKKHVSSTSDFYSEWTLLNGILQNLIENSIKYAREEDPYVHVTVEDKQGWIVLRVADNGKGIPPEHQARVFEMFYRAAKGEAGSGLGLYILKRSVDRLKGTVEIKSDVGTGTTFTVRLPSLTESSPVELA